MSSLTAVEKRTLERLLSMGGGYVVNFSNRTFQEFFLDVLGLDIYDPVYDRGSGSKANRLRAFWDREPDHLVGKALSAMMDIVQEGFEPDMDLLARGRAIAARLHGAAGVDDLSAIAPNAEETDFETLARVVHDSINAGEPEVGLDRLHTFVVKYVHVLAEAEGIEVSKEKPLHGVFGEVLKALRARGLITTDMTERILKSAISTLESFNTVRNDHTFAHPNPLLSFDEGLVIFRHVASTIRFLRCITDTND